MTARGGNEPQSFADLGDLRDLAGSLLDHKDDLTEAAAFVRDHAADLRDVIAFVGEHRDEIEKAMAFLREHGDALVDLLRDLPDLLGGLGAHLRDAGAATAEAAEALKTSSRP